MNLFRKQHDVFWCPFLLDGDWHNTGYFEPEPLIKYLVSERDNEVEYLKCPAWHDYYKNAFLMRSPVDLTLQVNTLPTGEKVLMTKDFNQNFYNTHIMPRFDQNNKFSMFTLDFSYVFYSEHDVSMELIPATMEKTDFIKNTNLISGEYNIAKWIRPVSPAFEVIDDQKVLTIKRGDPLYYIRFNTDKKVNLIRVEQSSTIEKVEKACARLKFFVPRNTLQENYQAAASLINVHKGKLFKKSKCPFGFLKKD